LFSPVHVGPNKIQAYLIPDKFLNEYVSVEQQNDNLDIFLIHHLSNNTFFTRQLINRYIIVVFAQFFLDINCNCFFICVYSSIKLQLNIIISIHVILFLYSWSVRGFINIVMDTFIFRTIIFIILFFVSTVLRKCCWF